MLEGALGAVQEAAPVAADPVPAVGGTPPVVEGTGSGTEPTKLPGWTGQLTKEQLADIQVRVAKDPAEVSRLPKGLSELYASYASLQAQTVGALKKPAPDAPKEVRDQFYKELGRPDSAEGYTLERPQIPSGMRYDEAQEKWFRGKVFELGLTQEQAKSFFDAFNQAESARVQAGIEAKKAAATAALDALKQEWKDKFADNWEGLRQAYTQFIPEGANGPLFKKIQAMGLDNDPDFLRMFKNIYDKIGPPRMVVSSGEGSGVDRKGGFSFKVDGLGRSS
jgi:hypothetical protein